MFVSSGDGLTAPIPPVLGPSSPLNALLWSLALASQITSSESMSAKADSSAPQMHSSTIIVSLAAPKPPESIISIVSKACFFVLQTTTPFPAARPSALTTHSEPISSTYFLAFWLSVKRLKLGCGISYRLQKSRAKYLDPSSSAAAALGPNAKILLARKASASPATRGTSGPITTSSILNLLHS